MNLKDLIRLVGDLLPSMNVRYFVFGAVAMDFWINPRMTADLDIVVCLEKKEIPAFIRQLNGKGFRIVQSRQRALWEGRILRLPIGNTSLDIKICKTAHDLEALTRARKAMTALTDLFVATPEDIILYKLQSWRRQDQADIERLKNEVDDLETSYLRSWIERIERTTGIPMNARWKSFSI
ncbi:MAG: hypothetical protein A2Z34_02515 [Planctomycetes bacterium RBG_16_59_8]|nr:MAG: hypothetical protein A2Z34_02515 [Planctomycetes bacterium RBG_16_59_8]